MTGRHILAVIDAVDCDRQCGFGLGIKVIAPEPDAGFEKSQLVPYGSRRNTILLGIVTVIQTLGKSLRRGDSLNILTPLGRADLTRVGRGEPVTFSDLVETLLDAEFEIVARGGDLEIAACTPCEVPSLRGATALAHTALARTRKETVA